MTKSKKQSIFYQSDMPDCKPADVWIGDWGDVNEKHSI
jgi:hypothetical protein